MGQQTSTVTRLSDFDPGQARITGTDGGTPITTEVTYGQDDYGADLKAFGATSGDYLLWDESADTLVLYGGAQLMVVGSSDIAATTATGDVIFYGATTGNYTHWDRSANSLLLIGTAAKFRQGTFGSSAAGSGVALSATNTAAFRVYVDDGGAAIGSGTLARGGVFRHLLTYTTGNREQEAAGVIGQVVSVAGTNRHNMAGTWGSYEAKTSLTVDGQAATTDTWAQAAIIARVGAGSAITTINTNGVLAGVAAMSNTTSFSANSGIYAGLYVGKWGGASGTASWSHGIYIQALAVDKAIQVGQLSSTTAGSGVTLDATTTRAVEVHADDNDTARAVGTQGRAIFGRTMIYANNACEDWGVDGLSKVSGVAKTGNVSAGVVGRFESTGTCSTATGSGNTFVAGVMGRLGLGSGFTLGAGTYACGVLSFYNTATANDPTGETTAAFLVTASDIAGTGDWDYGLLLDASTVGEGIRILTTSGNGINFPAGETYAKAIAIGEFGTPVLYGTDELIEYHGRHNSGTETKPMMRVRASAPASTAMTTGFVTGFQCQAYGTDTSNVGGLEAIQAHVGIKGNCEIIADITALHPNMRAGWFKIEDLGNDLTLTGTAAVMILGMQWNSGTTLTGNCDWINLQKRGSLTDPADAFVRVYDGAGGGWATNLFDIPATLPYSAANSSGTQSGKIAMNVGGATKYLQCYSD